MSECCACCRCGSMGQHRHSQRPDTRLQVPQKTGTSKKLQGTSITGTLVLGSFEWAYLCL